MKWFTFGVFEQRMRFHVLAIFRFHRKGKSRKALLVALVKKILFTFSANGVSFVQKNKRDANNVPKLSSPTGGSTWRKFQRVLNSPKRCLSQNAESRENLLAINALRSRWLIRISTYPNNKNFELVHVKAVKHFSAVFAHLIKQIHVV